jgi:hypothetical protein
MDELEHQIRLLIRTWRTEAGQLHGAAHAVLLRCADDVDRMLREHKFGSRPGFYGGDWPEDP